MTDLLPLRDDQRDASMAHPRRQLVVLPIGTGRMVVAAHVLAQRPAGAPGRTNTSRPLPGGRLGPADGRPGTAPFSWCRWPSAGCEGGGDPAGRHLGTPPPSGRHWEARREVIALQKPPRNPDEVAAARDGALVEYRLYQQAVRRARDLGVSATPRHDPDRPEGCNGPEIVALLRLHAPLGGLTAPLLTYRAAQIEDLTAELASRLEERGAAIQPRSLNQGLER